MKASQLRARYWRIVFFFGRVTLGVIFWEIFLRRVGLGGWAASGRSERNRQTAVRFRALAISMGGLMIKVGQFLSARLDVLPPEITDELAGLQDEVPAESFAAIRAKAESELALPLTEHYAFFDETPLAAASLGQVHRARLNEADAAEAGFANVVVKVQRPHIEAVVETDLAAIRRVGTWLQRYKPVSDRADVGALIEEFATTTRAEIDYLAEGANAETFSANFAGDPRVRVPRVLWELTTRRVLTLEDVSAIKLGDYDAITAAGGVVTPLSRNGALLEINLAHTRAPLAAAHLQQLARIGSNIAWLDLGGSAASDGMLSQLKALPNLRRLHLERTAIGDAGLAHLVGLKQLEYLNLVGTKVGDAGLYRLHDLDRLERVYLWQSKVTAAGAKKLQAALPKTQVNHGL